jgi:hypothetical protein
VLVWGTAREIIEATCRFLATSREFGAASTNYRGARGQRLCRRGHRSRGPATFSRHAVMTIVSQRTQNRLTRVWPAMRAVPCLGALNRRSVGADSRLARHRACAGALASAQKMRGANGLALQHAPDCAGRATVGPSRLLARANPAAPKAGAFAMDPAPASAPGRSVAPGVSALPESPLPVATFTERLTCCTGAKDSLKPAICLERP